jgi:hypothetical protein
VPYILYFHCNHSPCYHPCITTNIINKHKFQILVLFFIYICVYNVLKVNWMIVQKASNLFVEDLYTQGSKNCLRRRIHLQFTYSMCSSFLLNGVHLDAILKISIKDSWDLRISITTILSLFKTNFVGT